MTLDSPERICNPRQTNRAAGDTN